MYSHTQRWIPTSPRGLNSAQLSATQRLWPAEIQLLSPWVLRGTGGTQSQQDPLSPHSNPTTVTCSTAGAITACEQQEPNLAPGAPQQGQRNTDRKAQTAAGHGAGSSTASPVFAWREALSHRAHGCSSLFCNLQQSHECQLSFQLHHLDHIY